MGCSVRLEGRAADCMRIPGKDHEHVLKGVANTGLTQKHANTLQLSTPSRVQRERSAFTRQGGACSMHVSPTQYKTLLDS